VSARPVLPRDVQLAIGQRLRAEYTVAASPLPERLAVLLTQLGDPAAASGPNVRPAMTRASPSDCLGRGIRQSVRCPGQPMSDATDISEDSSIGVKKHSPETKFDLSR
jgi:hypothetical protein